MPDCLQMVRRVEPLIVGRLGIVMLFDDNRKILPGAQPQGAFGAVGAGTQGVITWKHEGLIVPFTGEWAV